jgi:hypothetical protein
MKDLKKYVEKSCANYDSDGKCLLETSTGDRTCFYFQDGFKRCPYAESCVIPADPDLEIRYMAALNSDQDGTAFCSRCKSRFNKRGRAIYCEKCREQVRKETKRKSARKIRSK